MANTSWNEDTRVKLPALIHLTRLGYKYFSLKDESYEIDKETNIIKNIFCNQFLKINNLDKNNTEDIKLFEKEFQNIKLLLNQDDLGKDFYTNLIGEGKSQYKRIDRENFEKNEFHVCTELPCENGEDNFRPDITVFVNGLPLSFIEVKKPNNIEGIKAERDRINVRMKNVKFRRFINITQFMIFSNNMPYDNTGENQLTGAFYATVSKGKVKFNNFREKLKGELIDGIKEINNETEDFILKDNNHIIQKYQPEFNTNKNPDSPTNSILTSMFTKSRLKMLLKYGIVYVNEVHKDGTQDLQKHIMRYPQFFATKAIEKKLNEGVKKGIIWHTQGSGKTALAFYNVKYLTDYFRKQGVIPKFYFIVDRLDLAKQATREFKKRGLDVNIINSKKELIDDFKDQGTKAGITVMNIQKFSEDVITFTESYYDTKLQRIYFIDEAHRSYDPKGSYLANLYNSDKDSIKIALTGTPLIIYKNHQKLDDEVIDLIGKENVKTTKNIFGDYIDKYYYNDSIKDGYTLRLLREEIATTYKEKMRNIESELKQEIESGQLKKKALYAHEKFVSPMLDYILDDLKNSRIRFGDDTIGSMVVCDSSEQARMMAKLFEEKKGKYGFTSALILHDEGDKETRDNEILDFKEGKIDILFVYAMLLTGFDAPRLKKMYLGRKVKAHNLLQTLTRVNRPYKDLRFGYVVDFANISEEFDATNKAYLEELNREYDEYENDPIFNGLFMSKEEIDIEIEKINNVLCDYPTDNLELFSQNISEIKDKKVLNEIRKSLEQARDLYNIIRLLGYTEILEKLDIKVISELLNETERHIQLLNYQENINDISSQELLNVAIENVMFDFVKIGEEELKILANNIAEDIAKARKEISDNRDPKDPEWVSLYEELKRIFQQYDIINMDSANLESKALKKLYDEINSLNKKAKDLNLKNKLLADNFHGDKKYARVFKKFVPSGKVSDNRKLFQVMEDIKSQIDDAIGKNSGIMDNPNYLNTLLGSVVADYFYNNDSVQPEILLNISDYLTQEYLEEYKNN